MTEDVVAAVEQPRELVVRICEVFEAIFPKSHVFEAAERLVVALDPVGRRKRHQKEESTDIGYQRANHQGV